MGYVNGKIKPLTETDKDYEEWHPIDKLVMSWLLNSMEPKISEIFAFSGNALDLWESIRDFYGHQKNAAHIFELQREIAEVKQDGKSFTDHL